MCDVEVSMDCDFVRVTSYHLEHVYNDVSSLRLIEAARLESGGCHLKASRSDRRYLVECNTLSASVDIRKLSRFAAHARTQLARVDRGIWKYSLDRH